MKTQYKYSAAEAQKFNTWLEKLKTIWEKRLPEDVVGLCAEKFDWYETPFDEPITTKESLLQEWQSVVQQEDITVTYDILSTDSVKGIAHWHAVFRRLPSGEQAELDGIFEVSLDERGLCIEFRQWYNSKE